MRLVLSESMRTRWIARPEVMIASIVVVWVASAAVYAAVFAY
jgi:hypothetical protein